MDLHKHIVLLLAVGFAINSPTGVSGQIISTIKSTKYPLVPAGLALDKSGDIYVADGYNGDILEFIYPSWNSYMVCGNGLGTGYGGDGGPATLAKLGLPLGVAIDDSGNMFIADGDNNRIRKVEFSTQKIYTYAGTGIAGYSGDGVLPDSAELHGPSGVTIDKLGNIYIVDSHNSRIREIKKSTGLITTIAGDGIAGYSGDGGPATAAEFGNPNQLALDTSGNIYIADQDNDRIRKITISTGIISTVAGNGKGYYTGDGIAATSATIYYPSGVALDDSGNIYIADSYNHRIRKVFALTGIITTIAGNGTAGFSGDGGPATAAELNYPGSVVLGDSGIVYISDGNNGCLRKITPGILTGINNLSSTNNITIYPNPATGIFTFEEQGVKYIERLEIYNMFGENIYNTEFSTTTVQIDLSGRPVGVYLYMVVSDKGEMVTSGKLIIQ